MSGGIKLSVGDSGQLRMQELDFHESDGAVEVKVRIGSGFKCIELTQCGVEVNLFFDSETSLIQWARELYQKAQKHAPMSQVGPVGDLKHVNGVQS
jgi:hypothetical protein